jgi:hypothetical protein
MEVRGIEMDLEARLLQGPYGRELLRAIHKSTSVLQWGDPRQTASNHGSCFFLRTDRTLFGVTAKHVYHAYLASKASTPTIICQLDNIRFDPRERFIAEGRECDIATFVVSPAELAKIERMTVPWPPVIPSPPQAVLLSGYPGVAKTFHGAHHVDLFDYLAVMAVASVNERDISMIKAPNSDLRDVWGKGLPPEGLDLAGMSGGPVAVLQENAGIISWSISGVIYESHAKLEIIKAGRADLIADDGTLYG